MMYYKTTYLTNNLHPQDMISFNKSVQCGKQQVLIKLSYLGYEGCVTCVQDKTLWNLFPDGLLLLW